MFSIKDGKVVAKFDDGEVALALADVKLDVDMLALVGLARVSRETVAGLATSDQAKAKAKLTKRWDLWKSGKWETGRIKVPALSEAEIHEICLGVLDFNLKAVGMKDTDVARARKLIAAKDEKATATFAIFCKNNAKQIKQRMKETLKATKLKDEMKF